MIPDDDESISNVKVFFELNNWMDNTGYSYITWHTEEEQVKFVSLFSSRPTV